MNSRLDTIEESVNIKKDHVKLTYLKNRVKKKKKKQRLKSEP